MKQGFAFDENPSSVEWAYHEGRTAQLYPVAVCAMSQIQRPDYF
jgi:hypothetical protein